MDRRQKSALRTHHINLANELILDEDFFASLRQNKVFTDGMLQMIKNVTGPRVQVYKMLELLEKRGPDAYHSFVWILKENFSWLADELENTYHMKRQEKSANHHIYYSDMSSKKEQMNQTRVPISIQSPTSANSSSNPVKTIADIKSEKIYLKGNKENYYIVDEQDGYTSEMKTHRKQFADKCTSPIRIIGCPIQLFQQDFSSGPTEIEDKHAAEQNEVNSENEKNQDAMMTVDDDSLLDDENSDASDLNEIDGDDDAELIDGEIFYDRMRRESEINEADNNDLVQIGTNNDVDGDIEQIQGDNDADSQLNSSIESDQTEDNSDMQDMYAKLLECTKSVPKPDIDLYQKGVTYKMVNELIDKLIEDKENGEESVKMVQKCLNLFPEEDRKFSLNKIIEKLMAEEADKSKRLSEEVRKTHEMANDMYNHSEDMKNIDKMKARMNEQKQEISLLKIKSLNLERKRAKETNELKQEILLLKMKNLNLERKRAKEINEMEKKLKEVKLEEEIGQVSTEKKSPSTPRTTQRRFAPGKLSPRKPSMGLGSQFKPAYTGSQSSLRPAASSASTSHYQKR